MNFKMLTAGLVVAGLMPAPAQAAFVKKCFTNAMTDKRSCVYQSETVQGSDVMLACVANRLSIYIKARALLQGHSEVPVSVTMKARFDSEPHILIKGRLIYPKVLVFKIGHLIPRFKSGARFRYSLNVWRDGYVKKIYPQISLAGATKAIDELGCR